MKPGIALYPTSEQIRTLLAGPADQPVVMLAEGMIAFVESKGGRVLWSGRVASQLIGEGGEVFHMVGLVEYPSRQAFAEIAGDPYVQEIGAHRAAGLEGQWLLAATEASP